MDSTTFVVYSAMAYDVTTAGNYINGSYSEDGVMNKTQVRHIDENEQRQNFIFLTFLFVAIAVGNVTVLLSIVLSKSGIKSRMNFFMVHLAIADLLVGVSVLTSLIWQIVYVWHAGDVMCRIVYYLKNVLTYASNYILVAMTIDRLDAIARPMKFFGSGLRAKLLVGSAWGVSLLFAFPVIIFSTSSLGRYGVIECRLKLPHPSNWQLYITLNFIVVFIIPALIIIVCYAIIVSVIWRKSTFTSFTSSASTASTVTGTSRVDTSFAGRRSLHGNHIPLHQRLQRLSRLSRTANSNDQFLVRQGSSVSSSVSFNSRFQCREERARESRGVIPQAKVKTVKMTFVIVLAFVFCWCPYFIYNLVFVYKVFPAPTSHGPISMFMQNLGYFNSVADPIIYCLFSKGIGRDFRRALSRLSASKLCQRTARECWSCCRPATVNRSIAATSPSCSTVNDQIHPLPAPPLATISLRVADDGCGQSRRHVHRADREAGQEEAAEAVADSFSIVASVDVDGATVPLARWQSQSRSPGVPGVRSSPMHETQVLLTSVQDNLE